MLSILRTLQTNRYLIRGTCRKIDPNKNWAAIQAIKSLIGEKIEIPEKINAKLIISLLGPQELETLIFLMLINAGLFSPAWRAGNLPRIDIIATNYSKERIVIGNKEKNPPEIIFEPKAQKSFQVKRGIVHKPSKFADFTVAISSSKKNEKILTSEWLLKNIQNQKKTREWIENSLRWYKDIIGVESIFQLID